MRISPSKPNKKKTFFFIEFIHKDPHLRNVITRTNPDVVPESSVLAGAIFSGDGHLPKLPI